MDALMWTSTCVTIELKYFKFYQLLANIEVHAVAMMVKW